MRGGGLKHIHEEQGICDPAIYPIFFPFGTPGWSKDNSNPITCLEHYKYLLYERKGSKNHTFHGGKLSQQYWAHMGAKIDQLRLNTYKTNTAQKKYRKYYVQGLEKAKREGKDISKIGYPTVLPSSYVGGPRYMNQRMHDAIAFCRRYKGAHFFITMTIDPKSDEIVCHLAKNDSNGANRADIVRRVFELKKQRLLWLLFDKEIFGKTVGHTWSVEYQKRGLPHIHIIVILDKTAEPKTIKGYDEFIRAEIPNKNADKDLYDLVTKLMIHKNCQRNTERPRVQKNGSCSKHFPKPFNKKTTKNSDGYALHRRLSPQVCL